MKLERVSKSIRFWSLNSDNNRKKAEVVTQINKKQRERGRPAIPSFPGEEKTQEDCWGEGDGEVWGVMARSPIGYTQVHLDRKRR
ncbi:unnamed protein product [Prunus armeniaca]|uniref:Uncharacterized protein n=1 Tax=Prunus armeniaca TaxID=36596 RepID=A0A6J5UR09_PRUAR|nr:unnamed protein product [Prunus armeniaca]